MQDSIDLQALFAAMTDVVMVLDSVGRHRYIAPTNAEVYRGRFADLTGKTLHEVFSREEAEFFLGHIGRALAENRVHRVEYWIEVGGVTAWYDASVSPLSGDCVLWFARDVSHAKKVEERLRHQLQFTEAITASLGEGVYALDIDGRVTFLNPAGEAALGWTEAELLGQEMHERIHYQRADGTPFAASDCPLLQVLKSATTVKAALDVFTRKDGRMIPVSYTASPITVDGKITGAVLAFHDISERQLLEQELRQAQKMEAVGELAGGIAHDFNNLLTIINGYSAMLRERPASAEFKQESLRHIQNAGERAAILTQRLLAFSRHQIFQLRVVPLNHVVAGIEPMLRRLLPEDIAVRFYLDPAVGQVECDTSQLEQVILNLALNARDAMPGGGQLKISTTHARFYGSPNPGHTELSPGEYALLSVSDTGIGITEEIRGRIFEPFFTTKPAGKGTGLGLSIVYGIVKQSNGAIFVKSEPGAGSTFEIYLPLVDHPPTEAVATAVTHGSRLQGKETILLVEDEDAVREYVSVILTDYGYAVVPVRNGAEAVAFSRNYQGAIDLLLTDIVMPETSGPATARQLTAQRPLLKVLYMSGYADDAIVNRGIEPSGSAFVSKPFSAEVIAARVRTVLDQSLRERTVLVVDDEPGIRKFIADVLCGAGYHVLEATSATHALDTIQRCDGKVDLVITDMLMPGVSGLDLTAELLRTYPGVKILYISAHMHIVAMEVLSKHSPETVLFKPFTEHALCDRVRRILL